VIAETRIAGPASPRGRGAAPGAAPLPRVSGCRAWRRAAATFGGLALAATQALAQPTVTATVGGSLDSFAEVTHAAEAQQGASGSLSAAYWFANESASLYYELDAGRYATPGDWSYVEQEAGLRYVVGLEDGKARLFLGASGARRSNGYAWSSADYRALGAMANVELRPASTTTLRIGYRVDSRSFPQIAELDQLEQDGFASLLLNLPTRTTLIGELHLGTKSYAGEGSAPGVYDTLGSRSGGGRGMGPGIRSAPVSALDHGQRAGLVTGLLRVAQSLTPRTGASIEYSWRASRGGVPPALIATPAGSFDDGVYDDPFASDARRWRLAVKRVFDGGAALEAFGMWQRQGFTASVALQADGSPLPGDELRRDRVWQAGAGLRLPLFPDRTGPVALDLESGYRFVKHRSNDAFYNYSSHGVGAALSLTY